MKTKFWFIALFIFATISVQAQEVNKKIYDTKKDMEILIGGCTRAGLADVEFGDFFHEYESYEPEYQIISQLSSIGQSYGIVLVLGTWCHDSQEQVPRFFRILDEIGYPDDEIRIIAVDGEKNYPGMETEELAIEFVPTIIFYQKKEEIGRIVETPEVSLEADWLSIIQ